jgi:hypothetical protein
MSILSKFTYFTESSLQDPGCTHACKHACTRTHTHTNIHTHTHTHRQRNFFSDINYEICEQNLFPQCLKFQQKRHGTSSKQYEEHGTKRFKV